MKRRQFVQFGLALPLVWARPVHADVNQEFEDYRSQTLSEYQAYKQAIENAVQSTKKEAANYFPIPALSDRHTWVSYDRSWQAQRQINYDTGMINITVPIQPSDSPNKIADKLRNQMQDLLKARLSRSYDQDRVLSKAHASLGQVHQYQGSERSMLPTEQLAKQFQVANQTTELAEQMLQTGQVSTEKVKINNQSKQFATITIQLPHSDVATNAIDYKKEVLNASQEWQIPAALIYAIIHSESSFNPMARSHIPAFGLMQIVPESAGRDATKHADGKERLLDAQQLYVPNKNIRWGSAYLNLLNTSYLAAIENSESRLYCTIAAYNTGAGNVAKALKSKNSLKGLGDATRRLAPADVYAALQRNLPYDETKHYLKKVTARMQSYRNQKDLLSI